jgi:uncharacterized protein YcbK (DUF882 family)
VFPRLPTILKFAVLGSLLSLGVARVSGFVKPGMFEPPLRTAALAENERVSALQNSLRLAQDWGAERATRLVNTLTTPREETVKIHFYDENRKEERVFEFTLDGEVRGDSTSDVEHFFRCRRSGRQHVMDPRLLRIIADISKHFDNRTIEVISAFRRRGIGAPHSKHYEGQAIDLRVRGVPLGKVRDYVWKKYREVGVGHYVEQNFIHVDFRPSDQRIAWTQRNANGSNLYHPKWASPNAPAGAPQSVPFEADDHGDFVFEQEPVVAALVAQPTAPPLVLVPAIAPPLEKMKKTLHRESERKDKQQKRLATRAKRKRPLTETDNDTNSTTRAPW